METKYMKISMPSIQEACEIIPDAVRSFATILNSTVEQLNDIRTATLEAITNCKLHAYPETPGTIWVHCKILNNNTIEIVIKDKGNGIEDVEKAREPMFSTKKEHSGLGFTVMEAFTDKVKVTSVPDKGTTVSIKKRIK